MTHQYNNPAGGVNSSVGKQMNTYLWARKSLTEARKTQTFSQLGSSENLPKHYGKEIRKYLYVPILDARNINDQGIDANKVIIDSSKYSVSFRETYEFLTDEAAADAALAAINAAAGSAIATKTDDGTNYTVSIDAADVRHVNVDESLIADLRTDVPFVRIVQNSGNLWGSSKDVGTIMGKLPVLGENGGRVNRVGSTRLELSGSIEEYGAFYEWTKDSMQFDTDPELYQHLYDNLIEMAVDTDEVLVQLDLLHAAGIEKFAGTATDLDEIDYTSLATYGDLLRLSIDLDNNHTPKQTKMFTGTRLTDTKTIAGARVMFVGSELQPLLEKLTDSLGERAYIPVHKYAAGGNTLTGEIGSIGHFRIVCVQEMLKWEGAGAKVDPTQVACYETDGRYDVFPMLVVGDGSFSTIGFQQDGKTKKFEIYVRKPGEQAADRNDPYGKKGFSSIQWFHGTLIERPERIALYRTAAIL